MRRRAVLVSPALLASCTGGDRLCPDGLPCYAETRTHARLIQPRGTARNPALPSIPERGVLLKQASFFSPISTTTVADFDAGTLALHVHEFRRLPSGVRGEELPLLLQSRPLSRTESARLIPLANDIWSETRFRATHAPVFITDNFITLLLYAGSQELNLELAFGNPLVLAMQQVGAEMQAALLRAAQGRQ